MEESASAEGSGMFGLIVTQEESSKSLPRHRVTVESAGKTSSDLMVSLGYYFKL